LAEKEKVEKVEGLKIKDLKAGMPVESIQLEIASLGEPRAFSSYKGEGTVCSAAGKDSDGKEIQLSLWNDQCKQVHEGDKVLIEKGYVSEYKGRLQLSTGKFGTLKVL